ncbi:hypothetical protein Poli38472_011339 [Pythium oligandrum]|uniref:AMP-dependent synthetase/ligase domain-containing protein n=1 Tax=Pythium oligandrum TaxID=41045 RepID=A0A8K1CQF0_PYTOL|nr:hypothetical protein Poli38472_011339 [Pythium oligandrum]|eukprot:TMW67719.1 hypothetical protein Poli38472_011339 [Pythium oligandrum]
MAIIGSMLQELGKFHSDTVHMSYLPLPHVFERAIMSLIVYLGAAAGFYQGDVLTLMDDMVALQPTLFISVPRLYNRVYDKITQGVAVAGGLKKMMFDQASVKCLGGRIDTMISGSAPLSAEVKEFMAVAFGCDFLEGYGLSETVAYYKEPEKTAEAIDQDGWFHTGDIGCWNADGTLSIIDRKKNIFKLSQGEYIAAEKIENIYAKSKYVAQIFVYGDSYQNAQLRGFEFVKKVHFHPDAFSVDAGLITPTFKLKRPQLKTYFQKEIDAMYAAVNK